ncbi:MAG: BlaI/MecI/CopY family transcriptional regulator [Planctomycetes bacterium]|nr:BlaI/MecI/CopY family transcriptional regulator [Planctomycetota bacterium]
MAKMPRNLTPLESLIMDVVWDRGEVTVRHVQEALKSKRDLAYTSVLTMMQVLERKGFVGARREGRANVYQPTVSRTRFGLRGAVSIVNDFFSGSVPSMISHFAQTDRLSEGDLRELEAIVEAARQKHGCD